MTAPETAFDRLVAALEPLGGLRRRGDHADARCPSHEDRNPSLSVDHGDGRALVKCQAGCSAEQVVAALGLTLSDLFDEPRQAGGDDGWTPLAAEGGRLVATYHYTDEHGRLLHATARIVMPDGRKPVPAVAARPEQTERPALVAQRHAAGPLPPARGHRRG